MEVLSHAHLNLLYKSMELQSEGRNIKSQKRDYDTQKNSEILI